MIDIALAADANYFPGLLVTAVSIARYASRRVALRFNVLDGGLDREDLTLLRERLASAHPSASLRVLEVDESRFAAFPAYNGSGRMAYARLLLPELVTDAEFLVYCDVDFLWTADIAELWELRSPDFTLAARRDGSPETERQESAWYAERGMDVEFSRYVCSGLMLVNLRRFRAERCSERVMAFLAEHPDVLFADQSAINAVVGDIRILPARWGTFPRERQFADAAIHFAGATPWRRQWWTSLFTEAHFMWFSVYAGLVGGTRTGAVLKFLGWRDFLRRRLAWRLATSRLLRPPFFALLRLCRRGVYVPRLLEGAGDV